MRKTVYCKKSLYTLVSTLVTKTVNVKILNHPFNKNIVPKTLHLYNDTQKRYKIKTLFYHIKLSFDQRQFCRYIHIFFPFNLKIKEYRDQKKEVMQLTLVFQTLKFICHIKLKMYNCVCVFVENINNNNNKIIPAVLRSTHKCQRLS